MIAQSHRQAVVELCLELSRRAYFSGTGGNVALRLDAERFLVTPSAVDYFEMTAADVCVVRLADLARIEGERAPSVETGLHARVLGARPDVRCSIHTHQPLASACALLGNAIEVDDAVARMVLGPRIPMIGYMPSGTGLLSALVGRKLKPGINAYLMKNHGVLCCGPSIADAVQAVETVERLARRHLSALIAERNGNPGFANVGKRVLSLLENS